MQRFKYSNDLWNTSLPWSFVEMVSRPADSRKAVRTRGVFTAREEVAAVGDQPVGQQSSSEATPILCLAFTDSHRSRSPPTLSIIPATVLHCAAGRSHSVGGALALIVIRLLHRLQTEISLIIKSHRRQDARSAPPPSCSRQR